MYGDAAAVGGTALAVTGFAATNMVLGAIGMLFLGGAMVALARR